MEDRPPFCFYIYEHTRTRTDTGTRSRRFLSYFFFSLHVCTVPVHLELLRRLFPDREQATVLRESPFILSPALRFPVSEALTRCCGETEVPTRVSRLTALTSLPSGLISLHVPLSSELGGSVSWASRGAVVALPPSFCPGACNERRDDFLRS